jgi:hypothetical protein
MIAPRYSEVVNDRWEHDMIGNEFKTFWWHVQPSDLPEAVTNVKVMSLDYSKIPDLFDAINDGYQPISHNVLARDEGVLLSVLLVRSIESPDTAETVTDVTD